MLPYKVLTHINFIQEVIWSDKPVVVIFSANWSGNCHIVEPIVHRVASAFAGQVKVCKINVDENKRITEYYRIADLPAFLFFEDGEVVDRICGIVPEFEITEKLGLLSKGGIDNIDESR